MSSSCRVFKNEKGNIDFVKASNGKRSGLFDELMNKTGGNEKAALSLYAISETEDFKTVSSIKSSQEKTRIIAEVTSSMEALREASEDPKKPIPTISYNGSEVYSSERVNPITNKSTGEIELELVKTKKEHRGNGSAKEAIKKFLRYTDALGKNVYLMVSPREDGVDANRLKKLYSTFGFSKISDFEMFRKSKPITPTTFDENGEPSVKDVVNFGKATAEPLSNMEIGDIKNSSIAMGISNLSELKSALNKTFVKDGIFSFNKKRMLQSGFYNSYEVASILDSFEIQTKIKSLFDRIGNADDFSLEYDSNFITVESSKLNSLGKQLVTNPNAVQKDILESVAGLPESEIPLNLDEEAQYKYSQDSEFKAIVDNAAKTTKSVPVKEVVNGELLDKTNDTIGVLANTLTDSKNPALLEDIDFLTRRLSSDIWVGSETEIANMLEGIRVRAIESGIDLSGISTKALTKSREDLVYFLETLENMILEPSPEAIDIFATAYNDVFDLNIAQTEVVPTDSKFDVVVKGEVSEYEMFRDYGLVKKEGEVYRQTAEQSISELYSAFFDNKSLFPEQVTSIEELTRFVQGEISTLDIADFEVETELLEKMYMYKKFFGFDLSEKPTEISTDNVVKLTRSFEYLTGDFVKEFNKFILTSKNPYFTTTARGIELVQNDSISKNDAVLTVPQNFMEDLAQYDTISKHLDLGLEVTEEDFDRFDSLKEERLRVINNPKSVSKVKGHYTYLEDGVIAVKNEADTFIRTPSGVYEMIFEMGNVKFFNKLPSPDSNYKVMEAEKPMSDMDFSQYTHLENTPDVFREAKNYYSKQELNQINQDYFGCQ
jgi:hypothetical protein